MLAIWEVLFYHVESGDIPLRSIRDPRGIHCVSAASLRSLRLCSANFAVKSFKPQRLRQRPQRMQSKRIKKSDRNCPDSVTHCSLSAPVKSLDLPFHRVFRNHTPTSGRKKSYNAPLQL